MRRIATALLALVLCAGCGGGDDNAADPVVSPPASTAATAGCGALAGAAPTVDATNAPGDFDGDGRPDRLVAGRAAAGGPWRVRMELAAGGGAEVELPGTSEGVKAVGAATVDVGPAQVAFAVVARDTGGAHVGMFVLRSCRLERVTLAGKPADFGVGTAATNRAGLACQVPGMVAYQATTTDGRFYQALTTTYLLLGSILDEVHRTPSTLGADDAALAPYGRFTCGALSI